MNYIKIKDIVAHITRRFGDFWIDEESYFVVKNITKKKYKKQNDWISIGLDSDDDVDYEPIWDVYAPTTKHKDTVRGRLRYACLRLGGRYAKNYGPVNPFADTILYYDDEEEITNDQKS